MSEAKGRESAAKRHLDNMRARDAALEETKRRAECFDDLLAALKEIHSEMVCISPCGMFACAAGNFTLARAEEIEAAIAKAEGRA